MTASTLARKFIAATTVGPQTPGSAKKSNLDRKSTRLNSSHGYISYAVFCLKKKKTTTPLGYTMRAVRDNEERVESMRASVSQAIYCSYIVARALSAVSVLLACSAVLHCLHV